MHRAEEKKIRSVLAQTPKVVFTAPMDARTGHFHRTVGYATNGCRKIRITSRIVIIIMMVMMNHCEGVFA